MKRIKNVLVLVFCTVLLGFVMGQDAEAAETRSRIQCQYLDAETIVVSGNGVLQWEHLEAISRGEIGKGIKEIVIEEGIIGIDSYCFSSDFKELVRIKLPDTLESIGKKAFKECESLRRIRLPEELTDIPEGCFERCKNLVKVQIPDSVVSIQQDAFAGCDRLRTLVLPKNLETWNNPIANTPMLKKIKNRSRIRCELDDCEGNKTWYVRERKRIFVPARKTAVAKGKSYKITYDLLGGKRQGILPGTYKYGSNMKLPVNVKKKGYVFLGWYNEAEMDVYYRTDISPSMAEDITLQPFWVKYDVRNGKGKKIVVKIDDADAVATFGSFVVRYSRNKDMSGAKLCKASLDSKKKVIAGLKKNRTYWVEISYVDSQESASERIWVGKRKIKIKK